MRRTGEAGISSELSKLQSLRQLWLYKTNLHETPVQNCEYLHHVELLGLSDNNLKCLPKEIVNLPKLKEIYLQKNRFGNFPKELCHIANLDTTDLEQNQSHPRRGRLFDKLS